MLPLIFASLLAFVIIMYVILDGFDLGIGILFPFTHTERERNRMMNSVAPVWDGNETWLVFGGAILYGAFPKVYGLLLPILYMPLMFMLIGLIFRGVSFEFRFKSEKNVSLWNWIFSISSITATFFQGIILGCFIQGFTVAELTFTVEKTWLTPFSFLTGIALVCGYGLLGATWIIIKTKGFLQRKMIHHAKGLLVLVSLFLVVISIWMPLTDAKIFARWYSFPTIFYLTPFPIITGIVIYLVWKNLTTLTNEYKPFIYSIIIFLCSYAGIGISVYPYIIPNYLSIWEASAPFTTLRFILIGVLIMLPLLLGYTGYAYYIFRGKADDAYH